MPLRLCPGETPRMCAHRGGLRHAPENTLSALRRAKRDGADSCEIDVRLTADRRLVVMHDARVDRTTDGVGAVEDMRLTDLTALDAGRWFAPGFAKEPVPTLVDAARLAGALGLVLRVEIKDYDRNRDLAEALDRDLAELGSPAELVFCSFDFPQLLGLKLALPGIETMGVFWGRLGDGYRVVPANRLDGLSIQPQYLRNEDIEAIHQHGAAISCFASDGLLADPPPAPDVGRLQRRMRDWAVSAAIDMITADDPARAHAAFLRPASGSADPVR